METTNISVENNSSEAIQTTVNTEVGNDMNTHSSAYQSMTSQTWICIIIICVFFLYVVMRLMGKLISAQKLKTDLDKSVEELNEEDLGKSVEILNEHISEQSSINTYISLFPLLGMFGTVWGLAAMDPGNMVIMLNSFGTALYTTIAGIIAAIITKIVEAMWAKNVNACELILEPYLKEVTAKKIAKRYFDNAEKLVNSNPYDAIELYKKAALAGYSVEARLKIGELYMYGLKDKNNVETFKPNNEMAILQFQQIAADSEKARECLEKCKRKSEKNTHTESGDPI